MVFGGIDGFSVTSKGLRTIRGSKAIARYELTPLGKIKAEDGSVNNMNQAEIIGALDDDAAGQMTKRELVNQTKLQDSQVSIALNKLVRVGYVRRVGD